MTKITPTAIKLGIFLVISTLIAVFLGTTLNESQGQSGPVGYAAVFDNTSYLKPNNEVKIAGITVGKVDALRLQPDHTVRVSFHVDGDQRLPEDVRAAIRYKNLVGDRYLELKQGPATAGRVLAAGATIPKDQTAPAVDLDVLVGGFKPLFQALNPAQVNQLSAELVLVFQGEAGSVTSLLRSLSSLTSTLADRDQVISRVILNLNAATATVDQRSGQLSVLLSQLQQLVSGLAADRDPIGQAVTHLNQVSDQVAGLLGDVRPDLRREIADLGAVSGRLNANKDTVNAALPAIWHAYDLLARLGARGNFLPFNICDIRVKLTGPNGEPLYTPWIDSPAPRCDDNPMPTGPR